MPNAYAELTQSDLDKIRLIVKDEIETAIYASEKRMKDYVDLKVQTLDNKLSGEINSLDNKLSGEINSLDNKLSGDIKRLDTRINGFQAQVNMLFLFVIALIGAGVVVPIWLDRKNNGKSRIQKIESQIESIQQQLSGISEKI